MSGIELCLARGMAFLIREAEPVDGYATILCEARNSEGVGFGFMVDVMVANAWGTGLAAYVDRELKRHLKAHLYERGASVAEVNSI